MKLIRQEKKEEKAEIFSLVDHKRSFYIVKESLWGNKVIKQNDLNFNPKSSSLQGYFEAWEYKSKHDVIHASTKKAIKKFLNLYNLSSLI